MRLRVDSMATGGDGVARDRDGRVVFVPGALPGEVVDVSIVSEHKRHARARLEQVVEPSPDRREPPCVHVADGCGGCDLQHVQPEAAARLKTRIVQDVLTRIGRIVDPPVRFAGSVSEVGYRSTVRVAAAGGRAGFRRGRSHDVVPTPHCLVAHPAVRSVLAGGRFPDGSEVQIRVGRGSDDMTVSVDGDGPVSVPAGRVGSDGAVTMEVAGHGLRVSAGSFFQSGPGAAQLLVDVVDAVVAATGRATDEDAVLADLYGGVGLFAATVGWAGPRVLVERSPDAVADARANLAHLVGVAQVVSADVERWAPRPCDVVIADPARRGLERGGVDVVLATGASDVVLVSCDPGALGRDAGLLVQGGLTLVESAVLDLFPGTSHVEIVSHFTRSAGTRSLDTGP